MNSVQDQFHRIARLAEKVLSNTNREQHDYEDDVRQFLQECWNLKDRIKFDKEINVDIRDGIESDVKRYPCLEMVADLANRIKHFTLTRNIRKGAKVGNIKVNIRAGKPGTGHAKITYRIDIDNGDSLELTNLVHESVLSWKEILVSYGYDV